MRQIFAKARALIEPMLGFLPGLLSPPPVDNVVHDLCNAPLSRCAATSRDGLPTVEAVGRPAAAIKEHARMASAWVSAARLHVRSCNLNLPAWRPVKSSLHAPDAVLESS